MSINEELLKSVLTNIAKLTGTTTIATECGADFYDCARQRAQYARTMSIEDANILQAMIDSSEQFSDASKMIGFDMEKARASIAHYKIENPSNVDTESALKELVDQANLAEDALAEIERLQGYEIAARDLNNDLIKIAGERDELAARIQELEDAHKRSGAKYAKIINELRSSVYANIPGLKKQWDEILNAPANGKIGPDADAAQECNIQLIEFCPSQLDIEKYPHFATAEKCWISEDDEIVVLLNHVENFIHLKIHQRDNLKLFGFQLMQAIKDKILGSDVAAVQIFPRSDDLVDGSNTYHLWTWDEINDQLPNLHKMKRYS